MSIIDDLLANPGVYLGVDRDTEGRGEAAAKIVVTPLPGGAGVTLDYETFSAANPSVRGHLEHAIVGRLPGGGAVLVSGHSHADTVAVLHETETGHFVLGDGPVAFPMAITISMPEPGHMIHVWAYGPAGGEATARDRAELRLTG